MKYDLKLEPETALERHVAKWLRAEARERNGSITDVMRDLAHGCQSGIVGHLIYYSDTLPFEARYRRDISALLSEYIREGVLEGPHGLSGWDPEDPLGRETTNRNILAWFGFEEAARRLCERAGWEG